MTLNPPRIGEVLAAAFGALLLLSLFLPWYRTAEPAPGCEPGQASCPRDTLSGFESLAALDVLLVVFGLGAVALLALEATQPTPAIPVAWAATVVLLGVVVFALVLWRTLAPPGGSGDEPLFAFLGLAACAGATIGCLLSVRNERPSVRRVGGRGGAGLPEPLPVPDAAPDGSPERRP